MASKWAPTVRIRIRGDRALVTGPKARQALAGIAQTGEWSPAARGWVIPATAVPDLDAWAEHTRTRITTKTEGN